MSSVLRMFNLPNPGNGMPEEFFFLLLEMGLGIGYGITPATLNRLVQKNHKIHSKQIFSPFSSIRLIIHQHLLPCRCSSSAWTTSSGTHRSRQTKMAATSTRTTTSSMSKTSASTTVSLTCTLTQGNSRMKSFNCAYTCSNF